MTTTEQPTFILKGVVGSTAHGLAGPDSDIDTHGVFSWPTGRFWTLTEQPAESLVHTAPDESFHELAKFMKLAAGSNPMMLELLFLPAHIALEDYWGPSLISHRNFFLSAHRVRSAYMGYADGQFKKLEERNGDSFSSATKNRTYKHAKHMIRLMDQGFELYTSGTLTVKVQNPEYYEDLKSMTLDQIKDEFRKKAQMFSEATSSLPESPKWDALNNFLFSYRHEHL